jgi:hypothetical protein
LPRRSAPTDRRNLIGTSRSTLYWLSKASLPTGHERVEQRDGEPPESAGNPASAGAAGSPMLELGADASQRNVIAGVSFHFQISFRDVMEATISARRASTHASSPQHFSNLVKTVSRSDTDHHARARRIPPWSGQQDVIASDRSVTIRL